MPYVVQNQYGVVTVRDEATISEPKQIRFITPDYKDVFTIPDGGQILLCHKDGIIVPRVCKYLDDYHLLVGRNAYHICEFAERMQANDIRVVPFPEKRVIWSNRDLDLKDWIGDLSLDNPGLEIDDYEHMMYELNADYLDDERANLDKKVGDEIIAIADVGRWNGRFMGYRIMEGGNLSDCLYAATDCDYNEWYVDRDGEFRSTQTHHDGTHYVTYRKWKDGVEEDDRIELKNKLYEQRATQSEIDAVTEKLGREVGEVYGWDFPTAPQERVSARASR